MRAALLGSVLLTALAFPAFASQGGVAEAVRWVGEGRYAQALDAATKLGSAQERGQAQLYVLHHAGALNEALEAGLRGLDAAPDDAWLLDRCAYLAISLGAGSLARELCIRLEEHATPEAWEAAAWMLDEAEALEADRTAEALALSRARWSAALFGLASLVLMAWWGRRSPHSKSSTPRAPSVSVDGGMP